MKDLKHVTQLFRVLSDPTRVSLLLVLQKGEHTVTLLMNTLNQPQSTVSRHLAVLRNADLVQTRREGPKIHYRLTDHHLSEILFQTLNHVQHHYPDLPHHTLHHQGGLS